MAAANLCIARGIAATNAHANAAATRGAAARAGTTVSCDATATGHAGI